MEEEFQNSSPRMRNRPLKCVLSCYSNERERLTGNQDEEFSTLRSCSRAPRLDSGGCVTRFWADGDAQKSDIISETGRP